MPDLPSLRPDTLLHIYYIEGVVPPHARIFAPDFVGNWVEDDFSFLFFTAPADQTVNAILSQHPKCRLLDYYQMTYAEWQGGVVEPLRCGRFLLNPTWIKASPGDNQVALTIDSGVVFGNGLHPTTQACLEAIDIACAGGKVRTMLDLGTGTGVLALAAAKLGCDKVVAVDFNYLAALTARRNVGLNALGERIVVVNGRAEEHLALGADLLVANIHYAVMRQLVRQSDFLRCRWFVLSGLLASEAASILDHLATLPVLLLKRWHQDNVWHTILGITKEERSA